MKSGRKKHSRIREPEYPENTKKNAVFIRINFKIHW